MKWFQDRAKIGGGKISVMGSSTLNVGGAMMVCFEFDGETTWKRVAWARGVGVRLQGGFGHHVNREILGGVALGRPGSSHRGSLAPRVLASNHGCLEGFGLNEKMEERIP